MKTYIGTKTIKATPAYRSTDKAIYPKVGGLPLDVDINSCEDGYMVMDENGSIVWSPKDVFEETYRVADTAEDGLIIERNELFDKLTKLDRFINSKAFDKMTIGECSLCKAQFQAMNSYYTILCARVAAIND